MDQADERGKHLNVMPRDTCRRRPARSHCSRALAFTVNLGSTLLAETAKCVQDVMPAAVRRGAMAYDVVPPDPAGTIESLGALGYTLESAIADLVDNSIDAGAGTVDINFHWNGPASYITVADDGHGMTEEELQGAMAIAARGPRASRQVAELGRFGMGLKTASFSQASRLSVWTRPLGNKQASIRVWDLEHVVDSGEWQLLHEADKPGAKILTRVSESLSGPGTVVLWQRLSKLVDEFAELDDKDSHRQFLDAVARVEAHLAMTFGRFLPGGRRAGGRTLRIQINGARVQAWDPFLQWHESTLIRPIERLQAEGQAITLHPFVLPPKRRLTDEEYQRAGGPRGWLEQQGFYVYRNDRLIVAGGWLGLSGFRSDEKHVLGRIAIEIPSTLDHAWSVDVKKATAHPPITLRGSLSRTAKAIRAEAQQVLSSIGKTIAHEKADELSFVWRPERSGGDLRLRINWDHPLVKQALRVSPDARPTVKALLRFMEETVPLPALRMLFDQEEDRDYEPFSKAPTGETISIAERMYSAYVSQGLTPQQAAIRLQHTSPFNEYPDLLSALHLT